MSDFYDRDGKPITMEQWAASFEAPFAEAKRVARDEDVVPGVDVSTVWLGMDHSWGQGPPLIFETMIFGGPLDQHQTRYSTEDEAHEGHAKAVELARNAERDLAKLVSNHAVQVHGLLDSMDEFAAQYDLYVDEDLTRLVLTRLREAQSS